MPADYRARLEAWQIRSPVVKFNASLTRLPDVDRRARRGLPRLRDDRRHDRPATTRSARSRRCTRGEAAVGFGEIYVQTGYDPSPAPPGKHLMSVFGQYAPYEFDWANRRDEVAKQFIDLIARFAPDFPRLLEHYEVLGPPDIEERIGLTARQHLPGRDDARPDVGAPAQRAHADRRACTCAARPPTRRAA